MARSKGWLLVSGGVQVLYLISTSRRSKIQLMLLEYPFMSWLTDRLILNKLIYNECFESVSQNMKRMIGTKVGKKCCKKQLLKLKINSQFFLFCINCRQRFHQTFHGFFNASRLKNGNYDQLDFPKSNHND